MGIENIALAKGYVIEWIIESTIEGEDGQTRELKEH